jgi:hypothetical protein
VYFHTLDWRYKRMSIADRLFRACPSRFRVRLFDVLEAIRFLDTDHLEDVTNVFPEFYED